jgi:AcrR family transcriptional regulator
MPPSKKPVVGSRQAGSRRNSPKPAPVRIGKKRGRAASYHHGDLRQALLQATEELLESVGLESFTLREVARRAGVSHGAPAHHFGDVRGLLSEFSSQSFDDLAAAMATHRAHAEADAFEQLVASGIGYVEYALAHRARFQLMFRSDRLDLTRESLVETGAKAYSHLVECITRINAEAGAPDHLIQQKTTLAWSLVHGFATLLIDNARFAEQAEGDSARALAMLREMLTLSRPAFETR